VLLLIQALIGIGSGLMDVSSVYSDDLSFQTLAVQDIWVKAEAEVSPVRDEHNSSTMLSRNTEFEPL
jgi:hypothetical protein